MQSLQIINTRICDVILRKRKQTTDTCSPLSNKKFKSKSDFLHGQFSVIIKNKKQKNCVTKISLINKKETELNDASIKEINFLQNVDRDMAIHCHLSILKRLDVCINCNLMATQMEDYGPDLEHWINKTRKKIRYESFPYLLFQMLMALCCIEKYIVSHGDIKPNNMLFNYKKKRAILIDFGAMWFDCMGKSSVFKSAYGYKAPETIINDHKTSTYSIFSDLYSLGLSLAEVLIGNTDTQDHINDLCAIDDLPKVWWTDILFSMITIPISQRKLASTLLFHPELQKWAKKHIYSDYVYSNQYFNNNNSSIYYYYNFQTSSNLLSNYYFYINNSQNCYVRPYIVNFLFDTLSMTENLHQFSFIISLFDRYYLYNRNNVDVVIAVFAACWMITDCVLDDGLTSTRTIIQLLRNEKLIPSLFGLQIQSSEIILNAASKILNSFQWNVMQDTIDLHLTRENIQRYYELFKQSPNEAIFTKIKIDYHKIYTIYSDTQYLYLNMDQLIMKYNDLYT
jgi:serine/threonine protein kinase